MIQWRYLHLLVSMVTYIPVCLGVANHHPPAFFTFLWKHIGGVVNEGGVPSLSLYIYTHTWGKNGAMTCGDVVSSSSRSNFTFTTTEEPLDI